MELTKNTELPEVKNLDSSSYKDIVPKSGITIEESRSFIASLFESHKGEIQHNPEETTTRALNSEEKSNLSERGMTDSNIRKSSADIRDGTIHLHTINEDMEGKTGPGGVEYGRKPIDLDGVKVEGVFPKFPSKHDVTLPAELEKGKVGEQKKYCNEGLKDSVSNNPEQAKQFNSQQLEQINNHETPDGYTWHHNEEVGKMQLVDSKIHAENKHTGGKSIWGGGYQFSKIGGTDNV